MRQLTLFDRVWLESANTVPAVVTVRIPFECPPKRLMLFELGWRVVWAMEDEEVFNG